ERVGECKSPCLGRGLGGSVGGVARGGLGRSRGADQDVAATATAAQRGLKRQGSVLHGADEQLLKQRPVRQFCLSERLGASPSPDQMHQAVDATEFFLDT